jgi:hypothetical protein
MKLNPKAQAALTSYARALVAAALPVWVATNDWKSTLHALWAAAIPPIMRWANPSDPSIGRTTHEP